LVDERKIMLLNEFIKTSVKLRQKSSCLDYVQILKKIEEYQELWDAKHQIDEIVAAKAAIKQCKNLT
jgi:hypothetical protein